MPIITIYGIPGLPSSVLDRGLLEFKEKCKKAVAGIKELKLTEGQVSVFMPADLIYQGQEIVISVWGLFKKPGRTLKVQKRLAGILVEVTKECFPEALQVECFVDVFDSRTRAFATSA